MASENESAIKWTLYGAATVLFCLLQGFFLQHLSLLGVFPFLFPVLVAVLATHEGPVAGAVYGLALGILCDLTVAAPIPCFYTLIFPLAGLFSGLISQSLLSAGFLCSLASSAVSFLLTDGFHCLLLLLTGKGSFQAALLLMVRETGVTLLFVLPVFLLFFSIYRKCRMNN